MLVALARPRRRSCSCSRPGSCRRSRPGFDAPGARADDRADPDHAARPRSSSPPARWRRACSTPRPVRRGRHRPDRLQPRDHRRARSSWCPALGVAGLAIGVVVGSRRPPPRPAAAARGGSASGSGRGSTSPTREARQALVLMAPRAIGLGATQITFIVVTSLASTLADGLDHRVQHRVHPAPDPDRRHRRAARRRAAAVAVARGGGRRDRRVPPAARPRARRCSSS